MDRVRAEINLFQVWWSIDLVIASVVVVEIDSVFGCGPQNRLVLVWASKLTWFCLGGRYRLDFSVVDRTWLDFSLGIGIDLGCVGGSKMTFSRFGVLTDRCLGYVLDDHSVTVECFSGLSFINERKRSALQVPVRADWVAQGFIRYKRTTEVRGSNPTELTGQILFWDAFFCNASPYNSQTPSTIL